MKCARSGLLTKGRPWALLATAPACPPPAQDGLRVCRGSCHRRAAFRTSRSPRTEPLTKPGDALCRAMSARTRTAPRVGPRPDRQRFSYSQPPRAHDHPRALGGDGDTRIHPSGRPGLSGPFTGGLRRCSGTPRLHSPGVRRLTPRIEGTRMRPRDPSRADPTGPGIHGTSPQLNRRPEDPRGEIERGFQGALMQPLHTALEITSPRERLQKVVKVAEEEIKEAGLSRTSWRRAKDRLEGESQPVGVENEFRGRVLSFVRKEGAKVPARQKYLGSTDVLESLFGKYKDLAAQAPCREITANVLTIPLLVTSLTADLLRQALETVRAQDVEEWLDEHLGPSPQKKKRAVLTAARSSNMNEGPEPA